MSAPSLKIRLLAIQAVTVALALGITGLGLLYLFERHVERRVGAELDSYITRIASGLSFDASGLPGPGAQMGDPGFKRIYSGLYWQMVNENSGQTARSRSLWDWVLQLPDDRLALNRIHIHNIPGPVGTRLLVHERRLKYGKGDQLRLVRLAVAIDRAELEKLTAAFAWDVAIALFLLGAFLVLAGWVLVALGLKPLAAIRSAIGAVRNGQAARIETALPAEVQPLVREVNSLLDIQEREIAAARNRANDLAHGFKTPLTALQADIRRLRERGQDELAGDIGQVAMAMRRQIERELASSRARFSRHRQPVAIRALAEGIAATLQRVPACEGKVMHIEIEDQHRAFADKDDVADILGNLMENAVKHGGDKIIIRAWEDEGAARFEVEDDGDGIGQDLRRAVMQRGIRLDEAVPGSGLGLAIVRELLDAYGQELVLETGASGGLKAGFCLPRGDARDGPAQI